MKRVFFLKVTVLVVTNVETNQRGNTTMKKIMKSSIRLTTLASTLFTMVLWLCCGTEKAGLVQWSYPRN